MTGVSVTIVRVVRGRALAPLLAIALACAALSLLPGSAGAQTPTTWNSDNEIIAESTDISPRCMYWTSGLDIPIYNNTLTVYKVCGTTGNTQIPGRNGVLLWLKFSGESTSILTTLRSLERIRL